jgi:hypothetical protein
VSETTQNQDIPPVSDTTPTPPPATDPAPTTP